MSIWSRLWSGLSAPVSPRAAIGDGGITVSTPEELEAALRGDGMSGSGTTVNADTAMCSSVVYACVRIISGPVSWMPLQVKRRVDDRTRVDATDAPLWKVLNRKPNKWMKPAQFKRMLQAHVLLRGNAYAFILRNARGKVVQLLPLSPDRVETKQLDDNSIVHIWTRKGGGQVTLKQSEVLHLFGLTLNGFSGVSPIKYARETIGLGLSQQRHGSTMFKNGARVASVLEHPKQISDPAYARLRADMDDFKSGGAREAGTLILEEGMSFRPIGMTNDDAQWIESRKLSNTDIAMFYGVPPHMYGDTEKSTSWGSGIDSQTQGFATFTLEDHLTMWEEALTADCLDETADADLYVRFNRKALIKSDIKARWESYVKALQWGVYSPNKVLELEDENPREGGDIYYPPPNMTADSLENDEKKDKEDA